MNIFIDLAASAPTSQLRKALELWADQIDPVTAARDEDDTITGASCMSCSR